MSGTTRVKCLCQHQFQDARYGKGVRVANYTAKGEGRCTVCGTTHRNVPAIAIRPKKNSGGRGGAKTQVMHPPVTGWPGGEPEKNGYKRIGGK